MTLKQKRNPVYSCFYKIKNKLDASFVIENPFLVLLLKYNKSSSRPPTYKRVIENRFKKGRQGK